MGLQGAFNSNIVRLAREHIRRLQAEGKTVKIMTVGRKAADQLRRDFERLMIEHVDLKGSSDSVTLTHATISDASLKRFEHGEFDVATLFFSKFEGDRILAEAEVTQLIPVELPPSDSM